MEYDCASVDDSFFHRLGVRLDACLILSPTQQRSNFYDLLWEQSLVLKLIMHGKPKGQNQAWARIRKNVNGVIFPPYCSVHLGWNCLSWKSVSSGFLSFVVVLEGSQCIKMSVTVTKEDIFNKLLNELLI